MAIDPSEIEVGKCYVTSGNQVRKVLEIDGDQVKYVSRGKKATPGWESGHFTKTNKKAFAEEVEREVSCDWDPDYPERSV